MLCSDRLEANSGLRTEGVQTNNQGYVIERLRSSLRKFCVQYGDLIKQYEVPLSRMLHDILDDDHIQ